ncbi:hypothetical protein HYW99_00005, partial [Candidatus Woesearchaeota archaeon]|nr:hypothetical protein [Candidatus Woesearchaeota archaeon]
LYIDKINKTINGICIKEEEILTINEISGNCNSNNEFKVECDGTLQNSYLCIYNSTLNKYKVQGLKYSGVVQIEYIKPSESSASTSSGSGSGGGSGGGGGGGVICISEWKCNEWSQCIDSLKNRKCYDANQCAFQTKKPVEIEQCITNEKRIVDIIKPLEYIDKTIRKMGQSISQELTGITGLAVKADSNEKLNIGIFIILVEVSIIVGAYLMIKTRFFSKMFK